MARCLCILDSSACERVPIFFLLRSARHAALREFSECISTHRGLIGLILNDMIGCQLTFIVGFSVSPFLLFSASQQLAQCRPHPHALRKIHPAIAAGEVHAVEPCQRGYERPDCGGNSPN